MSNVSAQSKAQTDSIFQSRTEFIEEHESDFETLLSFWLEKKDYAGMISIMVNSASEDCLIAGAIAHASYNNTELAQQLWNKVECCYKTIVLACQQRQHTPADFKFETAQSGIIPVNYFYHLYCCLLMGNQIDTWLKLADFYQYDFVRLDLSLNRDPDILAAESRIMHAAYAGDSELTERLAISMQKHYKQWKLNPVYATLWQTLCRRDITALNALLPEAAAAYKAASRRRSYDIWGGGKSYNHAMFDVYTSCVLRIGHLLGLSEQIDFSVGSSIWPVDLICAQVQ